MGNYHVRFLGGKGVATPPTYPVCKGGNVPSKVTVRLPYSLLAKLRNKLIHESRNQCAICGSEAFLEMAHIVPIARGGEASEDNMIALCPTCHRAVDSSGVPAEFLKGVKNRWVSDGELGKMAVQKYLKEAIALVESEHAKPTPRIRDVKAYADALTKSAEFDSFIKTITEDLAKVKSETAFLRDILKPLFESLGYEGVTVLHHSGRDEHGKDIVFYEKDRLGGFTWYAVIACRGNIHANSSKSAQTTSGHYEKILDQANKAFRLPYEDRNLKGKFYINKVVVACSRNITDEATQLLREWEREKKRHLIFMPAEAVAGHKVRIYHTNEHPTKG